LADRTGRVKTLLQPIERAGRDEGRWLAKVAAMDTPEVYAKAMGGSVEDWATGSLLAARQAYQDPAIGKRIKPGARLSDSYIEATPYVRRRLYQAGVRLAMVLNEAFSAE
jgi:hypothetical protein